MPKTKEELMTELNKAQGFIDACERARSNDLGLDEATYEMYNHAVERQKEIAETLAAMEWQQTAQRTKLTLWQLMSCELEDVHLVDTDEEHDLATIVELGQGTLSAAGRSAWWDVLSAKVEKIYAGYYGTQIAVSGCDPQRLADFSFMLAGHCDAEDYDMWVSKHDQEQDNGPVFCM